MSNVRIGVVGLGAMGTFHVNFLHEIDGAQVTAVCDAVPNKPGKIASNLADLRTKLDSRLASRVGDPQALGKFATYQELLDSKLVDAIIIATPHFQHPE